MTNIPLPPGQVIGLVVGVVLDHLRPMALPGRRSSQRLAGSILTLAGGLIIGIALHERRQAALRSFDLERPDSLVTTGPYALTRHPIYVGWWLIHLGIGVVRGSAWVLATLPAAILAEHPSVLAEEADLARQFGNGYDAYRKRVARYAPIGWQGPRPGGARVDDHHHRGQPVRPRSVVRSPTLRNHFLGNTGTNRATLGL